MKIKPRQILFFCGVLLGTIPSAVTADTQTVTTLAEPHPEQFIEQRVPMGILGLPLGTFSVIEGTEHHTSMPWGPEDFVVESVNGKKAPHEIRIMTDWSPQFPEKRTAGKRYVLHGYEAGYWAGMPNGLPKGESYQLQTAGFFFQHTFVITSVEKANGVTVPDAQPVDPKFLLPVPDFTVKVNDKPPMGVLGLPLGTFTIIRAHSQPFLVESPFAVDQVSDAIFLFPPILTIRGVPPTKGNERVNLRGFEAGEWAGMVKLPKSEKPSGQVSRQWFRFYHTFVVTTPVK